MRKVTCHLWVIALLGAATLALHAQTADTAILGRVTDPQGSVVPKATVTVTESSTGVARTATTSGEGNFEIRYLVPGEYTVEVGASGFRGERRTGITIQIAQQARINFSLQVGSVQQTLEVTGAVASPLEWVYSVELAGWLTPLRPAGWLTPLRRRYSGSLTA